jgi:hypothetical protein
MGLLRSSEAEAWKSLSEKSSELILRAAQQQLHQARIADSGEEAARLWKLYGLSGARTDWREFGAIAFHFSAAYPPDLAYLLIYNLRKVAEGFKADPVPRILTALENLGTFRPEKTIIHLEKSFEIARLYHSPRDRRAQALRILVREISSAPYPYATGIFDRLDAAAKPVVLDAMKQYNPRAAIILAKGSRAWMRSPTGIFRLLWRLLFGRE